MSNVISFPFVVKNSRISKVDLVLCLCAIALGGAIVVVNHQVPHDPLPGSVTQYMDQILDRMDAVGSELRDWHVQDVSPSR